jgi:hypothetical protein
MAEFAHDERSELVFIDLQDDPDVAPMGHVIADLRGASDVTDLELTPELEAHTLQHFRGHQHHLSRSTRRDGLG